MSESNPIDPSALFKLTYGLFVLTARDGSSDHPIKDHGCIINTVTQVAVSPLCISLAVNKANFTHSMILKTGEFNVSILTESTPFSIFERFGFHSGKDTDKFADFGNDMRASNGIRYLETHANGILSGRTKETIDCGTHTLFLADVTQSFVLSSEPSVTYQYYFDHIKPAPATASRKKGYICKICGHVLEGDALPPDYICPICKHGANDFEPV